MKKLLLPLLALTLVGCSNNNFGWKTVENEEYIVVYFGEGSNIYNGSATNSLKYKVVAHTSVVEVFVKETYSNGQAKNDYYCGTNVTVYHYEV